MSDMSHKVDECMAQLVDMGYAGDCDAEKMEKLKMFAMTAEGDVQLAIEYLEEDESGWQERAESEAGDQTRNQDGWRFAGWY